MEIKLHFEIAGQFGATFFQKYFPMVMYWNYIWLQTIIHSQKGWSRPGSHQVGSGGLKCGGVGGGDGRW